MGKRFTCLGFVCAMLLAASIVQSSVLAADTIKREAESADSISDPLKIYDDDPLASAGRYIGTDEGSGDNNSSPPTTGVATYNFTAKGGVYKILFRVSISGGSNSLWVRIPGATKYTPGTHSSGWIRFNDIQDGAAWHWDEVHSNDHSNQVVQITLPAGKHTLEIARREDGAKLDGFIITDNLSLNQATLPAVIDPGPKAWSPDPADGAIGVLFPLLTWKPGTTAALHNVYFGTTPELTSANLVSANYPGPVYVHTLGFTPGTTYYWRVDEVESNLTTIHTGNVWSFTAAPLTAYLPVPADGAKYQNIDVDLAWTPGQNAVKHEVYFSANKDDVANGAAGALKGTIDIFSLEMPPLAMETTYYWRVDEIDSANSKTVGPVWSFSTTIPELGFAKRELWTNITGTSVNDLLNSAQYPGSPSDVNDKMPNFESPQTTPTPDGINDYGGRLSAWLHVPVAGKYTFWVSGDNNTRLYLGADPDSAEMIAEVSGWTNPQEWDKYGGQKSKSITLETGRYYLMALWKEGGGGDSCAAAWQGAGIPTRELISGAYLMPFEALWAYGPRPHNGATNTTQTLGLRWSAGKKATGHQIYFSADEQAVAAGAPGGAADRGQQAVDATSFDPGALEFGKSYYWRVDEISTTDPASPWKGTVWKFTTADFVVVDDFESYTNDSPNRVFQTWIDGWGFSADEFFPTGNPGNGSGAAIGHDIWTAGTPYTRIVETSIVGPGGSKQSVPFAYNNAGGLNYSETGRTWVSPQDWTLNGVDTLSLQVRGYPQVTSIAVTETGGKMSLTGAGRDIWLQSDEFTFAYKTLNGDGSIIARVTNIGTGTNTWAKGGVMIRDSLDGGSAYANTVLTANSDGTAGNGAAFQWRLTANTDAAWDGVGPAMVVTPPYWVKIERVGDSIAGYLSADGVTWQPQGTAQTITMTAPVYIGICVTSHAPGEQRTFQFENIKTTANVTGAWQGAEIMNPRYNSPQDLYVAIQDSTNKIAVVKDAAAVNATVWTEVKMPLSSFTGVSMNRVKKMFIGVGDRNSPVADGTGMLYIDDIRVVKPAPGQ